jgi:tripeptidyl-peptidase-1
VPDGWVLGAPPSPYQELRFRIAVKLENLSEFEQKVIDISTPSHDSYGHHMTQEEVREYFTPVPEVSNAVLSWLAAEGVNEDTIDNDGDWIKFTTTVQQAEKIMHTTFSRFRNVKTGTDQIRTLHYSVPVSVVPYIDTIQPTTFFSQLAAQRIPILAEKPTEIDPSTPENCDSLMTPDCLRKLYNMEGYKPNGIGNSIGVTGYLEQFANVQDLQNFYRMNYPDALKTSFQFISVKGELNDQNPSNAGIEANLDIQYSLSLSFPIPGRFYSTAGRPPFMPDSDTLVNNNEPYTDFLDFVLSNEDLPLVMTTSYGDHEQTVPTSFARRVCAEFAQLGARGVSVIFSSGDSGVGESCLTNDGTSVTRFQPIFPATCPFVTSVGATHHTHPEQAANFSSGGFSDYFSRPTYQKTVVDRYLSTLAPSVFEGLFNREGRGFPDVAAQGKNFAVMHRGKYVSVDGTRLVKNFPFSIVSI